MRKIYFIFFLNLIIGYKGFAQAVPPVEGTSGYSFTVKNVTLEVDPKIGGRITSLKVGTEEVMYVEKSGGDNWGSTFWSAPQATWNWPPPAEWDKNPYTVSVLGNVLSLRSAVHAGTGYQFVKNFSADLKDTSILVQYVIVNKGTAPAKVGPWEITRFPGGGITFFPQRTTGEDITGPLKPLINDVEGISWFNYDSTKVNEGKFFSDGTEGWLAHVRRNGNLVIKKFSDSAPAQKAPQEDEIEHYAAGSKAYQEVEQQGPYTTVAPGDSLVWNVKWLVRKVPSTIKVVSESAALAAYVRSTVASSVTGIQDEKREAEVSLFSLAPSPVSSVLTIHSNTVIQTLTVLNSVGQNVLEITPMQPGQSKKIDVSQLTPGIYLLKAVNNGTADVKSFVVEH